MTLSIGLDVARSALATTADQTAVISRNVANVGNAHASRKNANVVTAAGGGIRLASITRASNAALLEKMLAATSSMAAQKEIVDALNLLDQTNADPEQDASPAALVQKLANTLQQFAAAPHDTVRARSTIAAANDLATALNDATRFTQQVRQQADAAMSDSVSRLNTLLAQFETVNNQVVQGTRVGADVTDYLDQRDQIAASISEELGIRTVTRGDNDMALYTDSGVTLFDVKARSVAFTRTQFFAADTVGNPAYVDGVPITGGSGTMTIGAGRLAGLTTVRDNLAVTYQNQLDEIARGLIEAFAESDQSAVPALPDAPGLFTYSGAPAMPASGVMSVGIAATIKVNPVVDPDQGGDASLLRDGGIAGDPAYVYNTTGGSAFADRLQQLFEQLSTPRAFDGAAQIDTTATLTGYSSSSVAWLQESRRSARDDADYKSTLLQRFSDALSKETGVNLDEEMTNLLELERSYQASSKLITTIDNMFAALLQAV